jgi:O-antigen/teichoic acid export membrane protein
MLGLALTLNAVLWGRPEVFFLERYHPSADVGFYSTALRLASLAGMLPLVAARGLMPEFSRLRGEQRADLLAEVYPKVCKLLFVLAAPLALGGAAIASPLIGSVFGERFAPAGGVTAILLAGSLVNALAGPATAVVLTGPRPRLVVEVGLLTAALNLVLDVLVIPHHGIAGAAWVNVGIQAASVAAGIVYAWARLGLRYPVGAAGWIACLAGVSAVVAWAISRLLTGSLGVLVAVVAAAVTYLCLILATHTVSISDLRALRVSSSPEHAPS